MSTDSPKTPGGSTESSGQRASASTPGAQAEHAEGDQKVRERAREVQERIEEGYHELEQRYDDARHQLREVNDRAVSFIRNNPAVAIVGAIGVGYVVGRLASRRWLR